MNPYSGPVKSESAAVCIGMFDGVHRGHQTLIAAGRAVANQHQEPLVVLTFDPHPLYVLNPRIAPPMITTLNQRSRLLKHFGADQVVTKKFTREFSELSSEKFFHDVLIGELRASAVIVGENFTFGHHASGTLDTLQSLGKPLGTRIHGVKLASDHSPISSSRIRALILNGDITSATDLLGHGFSIAGTVVEGDKRGRELGYPTANLQWPMDAVVPADGVYAGFVHHESQRHAAAISVGSNPQFKGASQRVEAFILEGDHWDLYGREVEFEFTDFLRPQQVFDELDAYLTQMKVDVAQAWEVTRS